MEISLLLQTEDDLAKTRKKILSKLKITSDIEKCDYLYDMIKINKFSDFLFENITKIIHNPEKSPIFIAVKKNDLNIVKILSDKYETLDIRNDNRVSLLSESMENLEIFEYLISSGADVNFTYDCNNVSWNCLHKACFINNFKMIKILLDNGTDINICSSDNCTPLIQACISETENIETVEYLLDRGADMNIFNDIGSCPIYNSIEKNYYRMTELFIMRINSVEILNNNFPHCLMFAVKNNHPELCRYLIYYNFDTAKIIENKTALDLACINGYEDCVEVLLEVSPKSKEIYNFAKNSMDNDMVEKIYINNYKVKSNLEYFISRIFQDMIDNICVFRHIGMEILIKILLENFPSYSENDFLCWINIFLKKKGGRLIIGRLTGMSITRLLRHRKLIK